MGTLSEKCGRVGSGVGVTHGREADDAAQDFRDLEFTVEELLARPG